MSEREGLVTAVIWQLRESAHSIVAEDREFDEPLMAVASDFAHIPRTG